MATKKNKPTPLIDKAFTDPAVRDAIAAAVIDEIRTNQKVTRAIFEAGLKIPEDVKTPEHVWIEDRLNEPKPAPAPLVPPKWWEANVASAPIDWSRPILTVSPQVAEVLNIGIDRTVDLLKTVDDQLKRTQDYSRQTEHRFSWTREFLRNARERLTSQFTFKDRGDQDISDVLVAIMSEVVAGIDEVLNEIENYVGAPMAGVEARRR